MNSQGPQSARLYVGGITAQAQQKDVEDLFGKFGKVIEVRLNRNFAFVQFAEDSEAQAAIKEINGTQHFGRRLDVQVARYPKSGGGGGGGGGGASKGDDMPSREGRDRSPIGGGRGGGRGGGMSGGRGGFRGGERGGMFNNSGGRGGNFENSGGRGGNFDNSGGRGGNFDEPGFGGGRGGGGSDFRGGDFRGGRDFPPRGQDGPSPFDRGDGGGREGGAGGLFGPGGNRDFSLAPPSGFRENRGDSGAKPWGSSGGGGAAGGGGGGSGNFGLNDKAFDTRGGRGNDLGRPPTHPIEPIAVSNNERTNDIEIIIVDKSLTEYGEVIERRMCGLGFSVDVLFPHEAVPLARVLGNIASRGTLYAVVITHVHQINGSLTLHILHGRPQEHRNMAIDDSLTLLLRNYESYTRACRDKSAPNTPPEQVRHLMTQVLNGRPLTSTQYDIIVQFLLQEKLKLVEPQTPAGRDNPNTSAQAELQTRILSILNKSNVGNEHQQQHPQPSLQPTGPLLQDPSIQKALDSLIQGGDILRKIVPQQQAPFGMTTPRNRIIYKELFTYVCRKPATKLSQMRLAGKYLSRRSSWACI